MEYHKSLTGCTLHNKIGLNRNSELPYALCYLQYSHESRFRQTSWILTVIKLHLDMPCFDPKGSPNINTVIRTNCLITPGTLYSKVILNSCSVQCLLFNISMTLLRLHLKLIHLEVQYLAQWHLGSALKMSLLLFHIVSTCRFTIKTCEGSSPYSLQQLSWFKMQLMCCVYTCTRRLIPRISDWHKAETQPIVVACLYVVNICLVFMRCIRSWCWEYWGQTEPRSAVEKSQKNPRL